VITTRAEVKQGEPSDSTAESWLPKSKLSPPRARALLTKLLEDVDGGDRFTDSGNLVLAELVTNAVTHGTERGQWVFVYLKANAARLLIEVHDGSTEEPVVRELAPAEEGGRGMHLVNSLSESWGHRLRTPGIGKAVWAIVHPAQKAC
jgi:anti-sigma regulatory factor (Ser/Thr protein kinase)